MIDFLGDVHACTPKILCFLKKSKYIDFDDKFYSELENAYHNNQVDDFKALCDQLKFNAPTEAPKLCFIGDVLADRGINDAMTLHIIGLMEKNNIKFDTIYSNHDAEFIRNAEHILNDEYDKIKIIENFNENTPFAKSFHNFIKYLKENPGKKDEIKEQIRIYLKHLKLTTLEKTQLGKILATHAPLNDEIVKEYFRKSMKIDDSKKTSATLSLDDITHSLNMEFKDLIQENQFDYLYRQYNKFVWNRDTKAQFDLSKSLGFLEDFILHIHGHHENELLYEQSVNLNNLNGKGGTNTLTDHLLEEDSITLAQCNKIIKIYLKEKEKLKNIFRRVLDDHSKLADIIDNLKPDIRNILLINDNEDKKINNIVLKNLYDNILSGKAINKNELMCKIQISDFVEDTNFVEDDLKNILSNIDSSSYKSLCDKLTKLSKSNHKLDVQIYEQMLSELSTKPLDEDLWQIIEQSIIQSVKNLNYLTNKYTDIKIDAVKLSPYIRCDVLSIKDLCLQSKMICFINKLTNSDIAESDYDQLYDNYKNHMCRFLFQQTQQSRHQTNSASLSSDSSLQGPHN
ncbi:hypothetical protein L3V79_08455 [Thiotrichales bacterium 19S9-12]|nr:hypothetical protein [Thiotrichales bacterium 19S9-11]MCF6812385.1 hypothetical protein [Thiotrichales bacterium 19S9-12]